MYAMKKIILLGISLFLIVLLSVNVYWGKEKSDNTLSPLLLQNVEALAIGESSQSIYCPYPRKGCIIKYTNGTYETILDHWAKSKVKFSVKQSSVVYYFIDSTCL